jgi:hypothetical protein
VEDALITAPADGLRLMWTVCHAAGIWTVLHDGRGAAENFLP